MPRAPPPNWSRPVRSWGRSSSACRFPPPIFCPAAWPAPWRPMVRACNGAPSAPSRWPGSPPCRRPCCSPAGFISSCASSSDPPALNLPFSGACGIHPGDDHRPPKGRQPALNSRRGLDFTSNDYLALAESDALRQAATDALARGVPLGAGGSRLLRGNHPEHEALEEEAASFFGHETALYFPTGFAANAAITATLPREGDLIVYDTL